MCVVKSFSGEHMLDCLCSILEIHVQYRPCMYMYMRTIENDIQTGAVCTCTSARWNGKRHSCECAKFLSGLCRDYQVLCRNARGSHFSHLPVYM